MFAARNIKLCTKDCMCLFVCPTGATDTENGKIDAEKCIDGCRLCVDSCPSHAIYLVYERYPEKGLPGQEITSLLARMLLNKSEMYIKAKIIAEEKKTGTESRFFKALELSNKVLAEDCVREAGYLIPELGKMENLVQSGFVQRLYEETLKHGKVESLESILDTILEALRLSRDAKAVEIYVCEACGCLSLRDKPAKCPNCGSDRMLHNLGD